MSAKGQSRTFHDESLFSDQRATRFRMEIIKELVSAGRQGSKSDYAFAISSHDFFDP